ncbi:MAG: hypothetical protein L6R41_002320 [Letrouitia leprolyta]|nr:MAG: hypothetical protein L6R41_002320 [Letrouitia leprolyta]
MRLRTAPTGHQRLIRRKLPFNAWRQDVLAQPVELSSIAALRDDPNSSGGRARDDKDAQVELIQAQIEGSGKSFKKLERVATENAGRNEL